MKNEKVNGSTRLIWLEAGYEIFINEGPFNINIEKLSRKVGKSKSSFYNLFADMECYFDDLLLYHSSLLANVNEDFNSCTNFDPDYINKLIEHKKLLLFNKQLLLNRHYESFGLLFDKELNRGKEELLFLVSKYLNLDHSKNLASIILDISIENFYLKMNKDNISYEWIKNFLRKFVLIAREMSKKQ